MILDHIIFIYYDFSTKMHRSILLAKSMIVHDQLFAYFIEI